MDEAHKETERLLQDLEQRITAEYRQAAEELEEKCNDYFRRFAVKDKIKRQQLANGEITQDEYNYWRTGQILIGERWKEMRDTLAEDLTHTNEIAAEMINRELPQIYAINHNYGTFEIERGSLLNTSYTLYSRETVERLIRDNPDLLPQARIDIPKDERWNRQKIQSAITQGVLQGESIDKIAHRLQRVTNMNRVAAIRNARTMTTSAQNGGRINAYRRAESMGIKTLKVWLATPDSRVRDSHARLDGEERETEEEFSNGCYYPGDPNGEPEEVWNCRCTLISQVKGTPRIDVTDLSQRHNGLSRDYDGDEEMTYQDWKDYHSDDPDVRQAARDKWKESEKSKERRKR
jgi:phage putative head morphogenesis protein, SPP1 gp7 family